MFTVQLTKYSCESKDRKIKVNNIIENMAFIWNHVKKQRVNRRIIVPAFTLDKSLVSIERMTPLRLNTLEQNTSAPNSPSPGNKPTSTPRQPTPPHLFPHRTPLMLVKCFICVSQLLFLHVPLRHKQQTRGCKLTFRYQMRQVIHVEEKQQHRLDGTQETTSLLGTTRQLARILGSSSVRAHLLPGRWLLPCTSPWLPKLPIFQEKLFWTNGNQTS